NGLKRPFAMKVITFERERESRPRNKCDGGRPRGHDQTVAEPGLKVLILDRFDEPPPRPALRRKGEYGPRVEGGKRHHEGWQQHESENEAYRSCSENAQNLLG